MIDNLKECEICGADNWETLSSKSYSLKDAVNLSEYEQKRYRVLFEIWFPDQTTIELRSKACRNCSFLVYEPRPEGSDIDNKYNFLESLGQDYGALPFDAEIEKIRSCLIYQYLNERIDLSKVKTVLDYGGGDARLMQAFTHTQKRCYNLDYNTSTIPSVEKIGNTIHDLQPEHCFDLIICSHVMEHVAEPLTVVNQLAAHLTDNGFIYIEVPSEIWKQAPPKKEPVTHINFFTPHSVQNLIQATGLVVLESKLSAYLHSTDRWLHCIRSIGQRQHLLPQQQIEDATIPPDYTQFLKPNIFRHLQRYWVKRQAMKHGSKITPGF